MKTLDLRGTLRRRWWLLVAGLVATAALAVVAFQVVGPVHEMKSSALLVPPAVTVVGSPAPESPGNPFLRLDGIDPALSVLVTKMTSEQMSDRIVEGTKSGDYTVDEDPLSQAPIVVVTATGADSAETRAVLDRVREELPETFNQLQDQAGIRESARITLLELVSDEEPSLVWGGLIRLEIMIVGVGLVGTLLLIGLWDALARSRSSRRRSTADEADESGNVSPPESSEPAERSEPSPPSTPPGRATRSKPEHLSAQPDADGAKLPNTKRGAGAGRARTP